MDKANAWLAAGDQEKAGFAPGNAVNNGQLERTAEANPLLQGKYSYDPTQFDRFLEGNTADENAALARHPPPRDRICHGHSILGFLN